MPVKIEKNLEVDFIGIGEVKSATSWLFKCISEHPQVCSSKVKEIHFFDRHYDNGLSWYKKYYSHCEPSKIKGEFTPTYLKFKGCAEKIYNCFPKTKLIISFRNPIDRLVSDYYYQYSRGKVSEDIDTFFKNQKKEELLCYKHLKKYLKFFPRKNILILFYQDIKRNPSEVLRKVYSFLEIDQNYIPNSLERKYNKTYLDATKIRIINSFLWKGREIIKNFKHNKAIILFFRKSGLHWLIKKIFKWNIKKNKKKIIKKEYPSEEIINNIKKFILNDIKKLEKETGINLKEWYE